MAENTFRALRNRDSRGDSGTSSRDAGGDPLAELARLIGQSDPNGEVGRHGRVDSFDDGERGGGLAWATHDTYAEQDRGYQDQDQSGFAEQGRADDRYALPPLAASYPPYSSNTAYSEPEADYPEPQQARGQLAAPSSRENARYADDDEPLPPSRQGVALAPAYNDDPYQRDEQHYDGADDQSYPQDDYDDDAPGRRRRSGAVVVVAVLGLAVLGSAGAFAYRSMFGGSMLPTLPPIIKASDGPNKIVPNTSKASPDSQANATTPGAGEKLVSREEQPVDIDDPSKAPPRVVSTIPVVPPQGSAAPGAAPPMPAPSAAQPTSAPSASAPEPKKIHTVIIRSDQAGGAEAGAGAAPAPRSSGSRYASRPAAAPPPRAGQNAPLALVPQGDEAPTASTPRTRTALARPTSLGSSSGAAAEGGYSVQVSSQRSEAGAKSAFRALQAKYPSQLGGREAIVRRADLGAKGVYYRALVGPYASMEQAAGVCSSMKAAGGKCVVQRN